VRSLHFAELGTAVNAVRATEGLAPLSIDFSGIVQASHLTILRDGLNALRTAIGSPPITFTETLAAGATVIKASHVEEMRAGVR
jgi:hypothetical protein